MTGRGLIPVAGLLIGCAAPGGGQVPVSAVLDPAGLTLGYDDGADCRVPRPEGDAPGWMAETDLCPGVVAVEVGVAGPDEPPILRMADATGALSAPGYAPGRIVTLWAALDGGTWAEFTGPGD